jgi:hypothetical protein
MEASRADATLAVLVEEDVALGRLEIGAGVVEVDREIRSVHDEAIRDATLGDACIGRRGL